MGTLLLGNSSALWTWKKRSSFSSNFKVQHYVVKALFFDPNQVPILKQAIKEPVAFMGGMFAGILRLDLNEDPLKEWVARTVEASGISEDDVSENRLQAEEDTPGPQQIEIE
ncbi:hypothetical protein PTKIN_Ptkin05aG0119200 [Pterospermum kingtungense]